MKNLEMCAATKFTFEMARAALSDTLEALENLENAPKLNEAKTNAGNDMLKRMQYVYPLVVQVQMEVIKKYGFSDNREGIIQFTQNIVCMEREDGVIEDLHRQVRAHFLPPVLTQTVASEAKQILTNVQKTDSLS